MRIQLILIIGFVTLAGCSQSRQNENPGSASEIKDLNANKNRHGSLTEQQLKEIKRIHHAFSEVNSSSLEETINNFKRDQNPDIEIAIWSQMADAYERFAVHKHIEEHDKKVEAYEVILLRSTMSEEEVMKKLSLSYLSKEELEEIFSYYADSPRSTSVQK